MTPIPHRMNTSFKKQIVAWQEPLWHYFRATPDRLRAIKATIAIGVLAVPLALLGESFFAITLALGALAGALSETDDHPRGRIKSLALKVICFAVSSLSVELLRPYPILLGFGLFTSTIAFVLIGCLGERYRGVTFGAQLVGLYTMLSATMRPSWYWQPGLIRRNRTYLASVFTGLQKICRQLTCRSGLHPSDITRLDG